MNYILLLLAVLCFAGIVVFRQAAAFGTIPLEPLGLLFFIASFLFGGPGPWYAPWRNNKP